MSWAWIASKIDGSVGRLANSDTASPNGRHDFGGPRDAEPLPYGAPSFQDAVTPVRHAVGESRDDRMSAYVPADSTVAE